MEAGCKTVTVFFRACASPTSAAFAGCIVHSGGERRTTDRRRALAHYGAERTRIEADAGNVAHYAPIGVPMIALDDAARLAIVESLETCGIDVDAWVLTMFIMRALRAKAERRA